MSRKLALIIGNTEYSDPGLAQLTAPGKDAEDFAGVIKDQHICAFDEVNILINENATEAREAIDEFFARKRPDDLLVLYFSGHGVRDEYGSLYLAVKNTNRDRLRSTAINSSFIREGMDQSRSRRQVLILDCCNSGAFAHGTKAETGGSMGTATAFEGTGYGRVVLTASDTTQFAWEGDQLIGETQNSLFTHFLVKGLKGEADRDGDGRITIDELYDYAYEQIVTITPKQTPGKWSYRQQGEIVLRQNIQIEDKSPVPFPEDLIGAINSSLPFVREGAVRQLEGLLNGRNLGLARSARLALEKIAEEDDSRRVSQLATQVLEPVRQSEQLAAQLAEEERIAAEKAHAELIAREKAERLAEQKAEEERKAKARNEERRRTKEREDAEQRVRKAAEQNAEQEGVTKSKLEEKPFDGREATNLGRSNPKDSSISNNFQIVQKSDWKQKIGSIISKYFPQPGYKKVDKVTSIPRWRSVIWITIGWIVATFIIIWAIFTGASRSITTILGIGWTFGGLITVLTLYFEYVLLKWKSLLLVTLGWAIAGATNWIIYQPLRRASFEALYGSYHWIFNIIIGQFGWTIFLPISGALGGLVLAIILYIENILPSWKSIIVIVFGWMIGWAIGGIIGWNIIIYNGEIIRAIYRSIYNATGIFNSGLAILLIIIGLFGGVIGGWTMIWQIRKDMSTRTLSE